MKRAILFIIMLFFLFSCFESPDISAPHFSEKFSPDSLYEQGIDAGIDNSIFLEWEEPSSVEAEGISGYYLFRGILNEDDEYVFNKIATIERENGVIFKSDEYTDYDVHLDTSYFYYLTSFNDFTESKTTSDTAQYKLSYVANLRQPLGDVYDSIPDFEFVFPRYTIDNITQFYLRLMYFGDNGYEYKLFVKQQRFNLAQEQFFIYLNSYNEHTIVLYDDLWERDGKKYLAKGNYRWKIDAISSRLGGMAEIEGSESDWMEFTIK